MRRRQEAEVPLSGLLTWLVIGASVLLLVSYTFVHWWAANHICNPKVQQLMREFPFFANGMPKAECVQK